MKWQIAIEVSPSEELETHLSSHIYVYILDTHLPHD